MASPEPLRTTHDFIVVGAGIAGSSAAYELSRSASVCLIEGESRPGMHSTGRSAALFAPSYGGTEIRALTRASRGFYERPPAGFTDQVLLQPRGSLFIARPEQRERLQQMVTEVRASGGELNPISVTEAVAHAPHLRQGYLAAAAYGADASDIEVAALHQGFLRGARAAGAMLLLNSWITQLRRERGLWRLEAGGAQRSAPVLVNAAGAWADTLAVLCGARPLGLQPLRRTALLVELPAGIDVRAWPVVLDTDEEFYFKPDAGRLLISPADETPDQPRDAYPDELDVAIGVDRVQACLDVEILRVTHSWAGLRTFAPDRTPVVGFDAEAQGFFWCAGQGGYGIQTAPALARSAAALARGDRLPEDVAVEGVAAAALSPARFGSGAPPRGIPSPTVPPE